MRATTERGYSILKMDISKSVPRKEITEQRNYIEKRTQSYFLQRSYLCYGNKCKKLRRKPAGKSRKYALNFYFLLKRLVASMKKKE